MRLLRFFFGMQPAEAVGAFLVIKNIVEHQAKIFVEWLGNPAKFSSPSGMGGIGVHHFGWSSSTV